MKHYPFNGKTDKEIQEAIANELVTKELQVLWANFVNIFQELEVEQEQTNPDIWFYDLTFQIQTEKMNAKVEQIISQLEDQEVTATRFGAESDTDIE
jgi:hypothetical protein